MFTLLVLPNINFNLFPPLLWCFCFCFFVLFSGNSFFLCASLSHSFTKFTSWPHVPNQDLLIYRVNEHEPRKRKREMVQELPSNPIDTATPTAPLVRSDSRNLGPFKFIMSDSAIFCMLTPNCGGYTAIYCSQDVQNCVPFQTLLANVENHPCGASMVSSMICVLVPVTTFITNM